MSINLRWRQFASWRRKNGLFCAIVSWIIIAIIAYTLLSAIWGYGHGWSRILAGWRIGATHDPLDRIKVTLTALGGVGAVGYLVIKYRERAAHERGEADEKLVRAVQQLGDASPQVRIAGVYALADVADTYEGPYHQRVVDILCGYLRTDRLLKDSNGETRYATNKDGSLDYNRPLSPDGPVESAILSIIANHLRLPQTDSHSNDENNAGPGPWSSYKIDLHNAALTEQAYFADCYFKQLDLRRAVFFDRATFSESHFIEAASFEYSTFKQVTEFNQAHFKRDLSFKGVTFEKDAVFDQAKFEFISSFCEVDFVGISKFYGATFSFACDFTGSTFTQDASFKEAEFSLAYFRRCTFAQAADFTPSKTDALKRTWVLNADGYLLDENLEPTFSKTVFNVKLRNTDKIIFPEYRVPSIFRARPSKRDGLPEGARWVDFETSEYRLSSVDQHCKSPTDKQLQTVEIPPTDSLSQGEGGEEDGDEHAQLVDGDDHTDLDFS